MVSKSFRKKGRIVSDEKVTTRGSPSNSEELLPNDLIIDILSILPIKCIARYKCVCRSWRRIIEDRRFIEKIMYREQPFYLHRVTALNQKPFGFLFAIDGLILEGCNATGTYRIRNHMSNQILELPDLEETYFGITSMGYASSTNEYKVLHLYWKEVSVIGMKILTAGVDQTWRPIHTPHTFYTSKNDETIYYTLNGILYIMMYRRSSETDDQTNKIIGFKFELYRIRHARGTETSQGWLASLGSQMGREAISCNFENRFHIWVLLENNYKNPKWDERRLTSSYLLFHTMKDSFVRSVSGDSASIKGGSVDFTLDIKSGKVLDFTHNGFMELRRSLVSFRGMKTRAD